MNEVRQYINSNIPVLTMQEFKLYKYAFRVGGIGFDIPIMYDPDNQHYGARWVAPKVERQDTSSFWIQALLPKMDYFNESTARYFVKPEYEQKIKIYLAYQPPAPNWPYYFAGAYQRLIKLPEHPLVPGMLHYGDPLREMADEFLSHDHPVSDLINMTCDNPKSIRSVILECKVVTRYRDRFYLTYIFSLENMGKVREINQKVKALLDSFVVDVK